MNIVTAITAWNDAVGARVSIVYSEVSEEGTIIKDNQRIDRIVLDGDVKKVIETLMSYAQGVVQG